MDCPQGHGPLTQVGHFLVCGTCGFQTTQGTESTAPAGEMAAIFRDLPSVVAIPLREYYGEREHAVMRLHRLCDAVEVITRFCTIVALGELRTRCGAGPLPTDVVEIFQREAIDRPTFGQWRNMLQAVYEHLQRGEPLVVPELREFVQEKFLPALGDGIAGLEEERNLVDLRNKLVHAGAVTRAWAKERLDVCGPWLDGLAKPLGFLQSVEVCWYQDGQKAKLSETEEGFQGQSVAAELRQAFAERGLDRHVLLVRDGRWLDLWPLVDYGRGVSVSTKGRREARLAGPLVYARAEQERLLYAALGGELPHAERAEAEVIKEFRALFQLEQRKLLAGTEQSVDFEEEIRADAQALIGRVSELEQAKGAIRQAQKGILWLFGPGGIGKSFLVAKLAHDLRGDPRKVCRVAWRFKTSDLTRGNRTAFLRHAVAKVAAWLGKPDFPLQVEANLLANQLDELLREASQLPRQSPQDKSPPRVLFMLDGLDEIAHSDPDFPNLPFRLVHDNTVWLCAGRPEGTLPRIFAPKRCTHVFPATAAHPDGGLPPMSADDIRGMLLEDTAWLKYQLLTLDRERGVAGEGGRTELQVDNAAVDAVVTRAEGLPLFVHYVVQDVLGGEFRLEDLPEKLPKGLTAYYNQVLDRYTASALHAILSPLVVTLAWARDPLAESTLLVLLREQIPGLVYQPDPTALLFEALERIRSMVRQAEIPGQQRLGYELHHASFQQHIQQDFAGKLGFLNPSSREAFCRTVTAWKELAQQQDPTRHYLLRHGVQHLVHEKKWETVESLLTDLRFVEAKSLAGMAFHLVHDYATVMAALPSCSAEQREQNDRRDLLRLYSRRLVAYALSSQETSESQRVEMQQPATRVNQNHELPQAPASICANTGPMPNTEASAEQSQINGIWRYEPLRAFGTFASTHSHLIHAFPDQTILIARNHADGGPVVAASEQLVKGWSTPWFAREPRPAASTVYPACLRTMVGHTDAVNSVSMSCDGAVAVSASADGTLRVWNVASGECERTICGHEGPVASVALAQDGETAVSVGVDSTLRRWNIRTGECRRIVHVPKSGLVAVDVTPDAARIVAATADGKFLAGYGEGDLIEFARHDLLLTDVAVTTDGRVAIVSSADKTLIVWDLQSRRVCRVLQGHTDWVRSVCVTPNSEFAVSVGDDRTLRLWDLQTGACFRCLEGHSDWISAVAVTPDGKTAVSVAQDRTVRLWDLENGACRKVFSGHTQDPRAVAINGDGRIAISAGEDKTLRVWDLDRGIPEHVSHQHYQWVNALASTPDGWVLVSAFGDGTLGVWELRDGQFRGNLKGHTQAVRGVAIVENQMAVSGSVDRSLRIWNLVTGECQHVLTGHEGSIRSVAVAANQTIVSASSDRTIRVWDWKSRQCSKTLHGHVDRVLSVCICSDGSKVVSGGADRTLRVWELDGEYCERPLEGHTGPVHAVTLSSDGKFVVSASEDGTLRVWDLDLHECRRVIRGHQGPVRSVSLSHDNRILISASLDGTLRMWNVFNGNQLGLYTAGVPLVSISPIGADGRCACGTTDGQVHFLWLRNAFDC